MNINDTNEDGKLVAAHKFGTRQYNISTIGSSSK